MKNNEAKIIKHLIDEFVRKNDMISGICSADRLDYLEYAKTEVPFVKFDWEDRINPKRHMADAKSIIVVGLGYGKCEKYQLDGELRGVLSASMIGLDYHKRVQALLIEMEQTIRSINPSLNGRIMVDTGPLIEREFALKAGIGWFGRNKNLICEAFGSFFNIGCMIVNMELGPDEGYARDLTKCGSCNACVSVCPSEALTDNGFDYTKCISYLTQTSQPLTKAEKRLMGTNLFGCEICQNVCKYNHNKHVAEIADIDLMRPRISDILSLTNNSFKEKYGQTAIGWRGRKILQRNAAIVHDNWIQSISGKRT